MVELLFQFFMQHQPLLLGLAQQADHFGLAGGAFLQGGAVGGLVGGRVGQSRIEARFFLVELRHAALQLFDFA